MDILVKLKEIDIELENVRHLENKINIVKNSIAHIEQMSNIDLTKSIQHNSDFINKIGEEACGLE